MIPITKMCSKCRAVKAISEFNRNKNRKDGYSHYCRECANRAYKDYYRRVKNGVKVRAYFPRVNVVVRPRIKPDGSIQKRCPACNTVIYVMPNAQFHVCWKCGAKIKILKALRDNCAHRGGLILRVVDGDE